VRALAEEAGQLEEIGRTTLPEHVFAGGVRKIIQRRLDRIPESYHSLLQMAAVIGRQQDLALLRALEPDIDLNMWLLECANAAVLDMEDSDWRFAHDKLRDGVVEQLSNEERRDLHRRVAEAIGQLYGEAEKAAVLAHHWGMAGDVKKEDYFVSLAGEQALRSGAYQEAVRFFDRALSLVSPRKVDEITSQMRRVYLQHRKAEAYLGFGGYQQAYDLYRDSLLICERLGDRSGIVRTLFALGEVNYALGHYEKARQYYQDSLQIYHEVEDMSGVARTLNSLGNVAYEFGDHNIARLLYQQSLTLAREIGDQWGMAGTLTPATPTGRDRAERIQAQQRLIEALEAHSRSGDQKGMSDALFELGDIAYDLKLYKEAQQRFLKCLEIRQDLADFNGIIQVFSRLGTVYLAMENFNEARKYLRKALRAATQTAQTSLALRALIGLAQLHMADDRKNNALELLAFVMNHFDGSDDLEDEVERMVFTLEAELAPAVVEYAWERGKERTLEDLVAEILS
jgi:tetratricopeptide (TPR) repeat protein